MQQPRIVLISEVIPVKCSKMDVSVRMKEYIYEDICIYPVEYKKRCYVYYVRQYTSENTLTSWN